MRSCPGTRSTIRAILNWDAQKLRDALDSPNQDERVFYFMSRPNGTWCVLERDAFLRESDGYKIWTHYANMPAGMKRPPIVTLSAGGSFTTPLSSQTPNIQITGATASMWRDRTRKNTPLWRRHSITFRAVLICIVTCFGSCPRRFPMSADGCSASTAIWPPDTYWPLLTNQKPSKQTVDDLLACLDDVDMAESCAKPPEKSREEQSKSVAKGKHIPTR